VAPFDGIRLWLRALFARARVETEMEKEMRLHLEMEIEHNVRQGMSPSDARRAALIAFGGIESAKDAVRDEHGTHLLESTATDVRVAVRGFRRRPLFAISVVVLIAVAIGANSAIFSIIDGLLIAPLRYPDGNRMVTLFVTTNRGSLLVGPTPEVIARWRARSRTVEEITVVDDHSYLLGDSTAGAAEPIRGVRVAPGALAFVGARPMIGRDIEASDTLRGAPPVALVTQDVWRRALGGHRDVVGSVVRLDGVPHHVIGILPASFSLPFGGDADVLTAFRSGDSTRHLRALAKLRRGVSSEAANRELQAIFSRLGPGRSERDVPRVIRGVDLTGATSRRVLFLMFGAVMIVLLIACANVASLMLARAWERQREFAVRTALGAGRARLIRQVLTESLTLALAAGILSIAVAVVTLQLLQAASPRSPIDLDAARLDPTVFAWGLGLTVFSAVSFGIGPALSAARTRTNEALKAGARSASGGSRSNRVRSSIIIAQVVLSTLLLVASGLLMRTIVGLRGADAGVDPAGLFGMRLSFDPRRMPDSLGRAAELAGVLERVRAIPEVRGATFAAALPPRFNAGVFKLEIEGRAGAPNDSLGIVSINSTDPDFFALAGIRLVDGRVYARSERLTTDGFSPEIVINESFARRYWPDGNAVGSRLRPAGNPNWLTVVGIARDVQFPLGQVPWGDIQVYEASSRAPKSTTLVVRSASPMSRLAPAIRAAVHEAAPRLTAAAPQSVEDMLRSSRSVHQYLLTLLGTFALLALALTAFGLHAVVSYAVGQRTREIGVRIALGAQTRDVMGLVVGHGGRIVAVGIVIGIVAGVGAARAMRALLYDVQPSDPLTIAAVAVVLSGIAVASTVGPARRAATIDPMDALRCD
jgi:predicted permease